MVLLTLIPSFSEVKDEASSLYQNPSLHCLANLGESLLFRVHVELTLLSDPFLICGFFQVTEFEILLLSWRFLSFRWRGEAISFFFLLGFLLMFSFYLLPQVWAFIFYFIYFLI
ncbi:hypothetical protein KC19_10G142300 [Ceratodon purpureus]|uniref:Uncharacterized protein n=1 Tax=Ceratodon purpureus TaxID=3225 RepID=A0A8T0GLS9_CERPU|nr:hypothetical protein KC19_10G142300 [Ceratodon purpureus]